ncbi:MAG: aspartyl/asparaginyl beta-hydroxylase domain-containing protein [Verrucomicrobiae bacterium]|nr:aspartyl/asparaginyl beta-hydroxylase domain-containing protein [Verrucomicrobiae bacterium]
MKDVSFSGPNIPANILDRTFRLKPPKTPVRKLLARTGDAIEARLAKASLVPDVPVYRPEQFPWIGEVESEWKAVRAELDAVMQFRDRMPSFQDIVKEVGLIQKDDQWKTFFLTGIGMDCEENARRCPETMRVLRRIPGVKTAFFSILSPHKHIPPHRGPYVGVLRLHLGLMVPEPRDQVRIRIADQICHWEEGRCLVFDDTYNHEVWNDTEGYRVVLFVDFARPMRQPYAWLNDRVLNMATLAPFIREAKGKQARWEKKMYQETAAPGNKP